MSYQRVIIEKLGGPEVLKLVAEPTLPEPKPGEVRLKVLATSACFTDTLIRKGLYPGLKKQLPFSPGYDVVGVVDKLGEGVSDVQIGHMVADLTVIGAYAEYMCRPAGSLTLVPTGLDPAEAVCCVLSYVTAYQMLHRMAKVQAGQSILVHGGAGAVGTALLQLGKLLGLKMYATASKAKHELVVSLGATPIDYKNEDFVERIAALTSTGVDAVFDGQGGDYFKRSFSSLKHGGTLVAYGFYNQVMGQGGSIPAAFLRLKLWNLLPNGRATHFYSIAALRAQHPDWLHADLTALFKLLREHTIKPVIAQRMPLNEAKQAHQLIEQAAVQGRLVLICCKDYSES